ncbi:putative redox protein [Pseudomonas aeruginosa PA38182]|nr:putative redox protein [Pseudomonas aeruginosa PA38182]
MKARIQWAGEAMFLGESGSGHVVVMDGPPDHGGRNLGVRPMEMVLIGLGGCTNFDVVSILKKARQPVESCEAFLEAERADEEPKVFTKIHVTSWSRAAVSRRPRSSARWSCRRRNTARRRSCSVAAGWRSPTTTRSSNSAETDHPVIIKGAQTLAEA